MRGQCAICVTSRKRDRQHPEAGYPGAVKELKIEDQFETLESAHDFVMLTYHYGSSIALHPPCRWGRFQDTHESARYEFPLQERRGSTV